MVVAIVVPHVQNALYYVNAVPAKFEVPDEIIAIEVLGGVANPQSWGMGKRKP